MNFKLKTVAVAAALVLCCILTNAPSAHAQNFVCPDVAQGDSSERCANTKFVQTATSSPALTNTHILVGGSSNFATDVALTGAGDCGVSLANTGVATFTCTKTNSVPFATSATTDTTNASNITSGTLALARLSLTNTHFYVGNASGIPADVAMSGAGDCTASLANTGVVSFVCTKTNGVAFAASATTDATNAANISSGTLPSARLPNGLNNFSVSGPTTSRTYTVPDANSTLTTTVAKGTASLGTSAITSSSCATVVTVSATGVATTDTPAVAFNGDPTAVTGYIPSTAGMLTIFYYPTANNINFKVCNNTSSSITPGAITLNWQVVR